MNELLSGERIISTEAYQSNAENNMLEMQKQFTAYKRRIIINNVFLIGVAVVGAFTAPWTLLLIGFVLVFRNSYLFKNVRSVKKLMEQAAQDG